MGCHHVSKIETIQVKGRKGRDGLLLFIEEMEELLPWFTGKELTGLTMKKKPASWLLIVRAEDKGKGFVAFVESRSIIGLYRGLYKMVCYDKGYWREDRFKS